jgi:hypothetical protein
MLHANVREFSGTLSLWKFRLQEELSTRWYSLIHDAETELGVIRGEILAGQCHRLSIMYDSKEGVHEIDEPSLKKEDHLHVGDDDSFEDHLDLMFEDGFELAFWAPLLSVGSHSIPVAETSDLRDSVERKKEGFKLNFMEEDSLGPKEVWFSKVLHSFRGEWDHVIGPLIRQVDGLWVSMKTDGERFKKRLKRTESYIDIFMSTLKSGPAAVERRLHRMDKSTTISKKTDKKIAKKKPVIGPVIGRRGLMEKKPESSANMFEEEEDIQSRKEGEEGLGEEGLGEGCHHPMEDVERYDDDLADAENEDEDQNGRSAFPEGSIRHEEERNGDVYGEDETPSGPHPSKKNFRILAIEQMAKLRPQKPLGSKDKTEKKGEGGVGSERTKKPPEQKRVKKQFRASAISEVRRSFVRQKTPSRASQPQP